MYKELQLHPIQIWSRDSNRLLSRGDTQMANKHQRGPSLSSVFREMQIETRGRHHSAPTRAAVREEERKRVWRGRGETAVAGRRGRRCWREAGCGPPEDATSRAPRFAEPPLLRHTAALRLGSFKQQNHQPKAQTPKTRPRQGARTGARHVGVLGSPAGVHASRDSDFLPLCMLVDGRAREGLVSRQIGKCGV